ncbi:MurR/RpiR family transcriptional regulator [Pseudoalteromonas xiamenensis]
MSLFIKIKALRASLSNSESKLADYTLNNPELIRNQSSIELASAANVSQSSVVKFAQKLGYKGFPEFKFAVVDALNQQSKQETSPLTAFTHQDDITLVSQKLLSKQHTILSHTQQLNEATQIEKAVDALKSANRVLFVAQGNSSLVARTCVFKLQKLGVAAQCEADLIQAANALSVLGNGDVLFVISHSAHPRSLRTLVELAKLEGVTVISMTKFTQNAISELADHRLFSVSEEEPVPHSGILTSSSQHYIVDLIVIALSNSNLHLQKRVAQANGFIESLGI